mgnify:CR=1 FL=1
MADGSIILDIEARDAGLVQTLAQARQYAAQTATGRATRKKAMPGARTFFIIGMTSYHRE